VHFIGMHGRSRINSRRVDLPKNGEPKTRQMRVEAMKGAGSFVEAITFDAEDRAA
jgi:hypothetical protein